jgi:nicotinamide-nucleotide amidase
MTADIITIGDEILIGQILDTNSQFIASEFTKSGINIRHILSISDSEHAIINSLDLSVGKVDFVILTGGLGPTNDDITKNTLLNYFGGQLITHQKTLELITRFFAKRGKQVTDRNRKQAEVPDSCSVLLNRCGTAPGMIFLREKTILFALPGVPFEMKELLINEILPFIRKKYSLPVILQRTILIEGVPESTLADKLKDWEENLTEFIKVAYLPSPGLLRLRLSISGTNINELNNRLNKEVQYIINLIGENVVFGFDNDSLEQVIGKLLINKGLTLSVAESCTGGNISHLITSVPGSSKYFKGSIVAYSNEIKSNHLNIPKETIEKYGAVSHEVAEYMAKGVMKFANSDCAIATTGIAGPDGGTKEKPVGTVCISVIFEDKIISRKFLFGDNRERNIIKASLSALNMLRNLIKVEQ